MWSSVEFVQLERSRCLTFDDAFGAYGMGSMNVLIFALKMTVT